MKFFSSLLVAGLAGLAAAQEICTGLCFTSVPQAVVAGQTYTLEWTAATNDPVTIILREGNSGDLNTIETITTTATGGSFEWTPSTDLENSGSYALQIVQGGFENYSGQFPLTGGQTPGADPTTTAESSAAQTTTESAAESTTESAAETTIDITSTIASTGLPTTTNGTASPTITTSRVPTPPASTTTGGDAPAETTGAASQLKSPAALVLGAIAALAYLQ